ncbi:hypothetical protein BDZ94DRAFT_1297829 [Collybia nuda]|uniref:Uncharacterized protein n=1 Tax=Collybia nuda TaxID=64659 RepID=A0A9P5Y4K9_9AGAR|nr:hypothetical protein BDZ94DRAFT_1297829 [Collybia nuda]
MSLSRVCFVDSTNTPRARKASRPTSSRLFPKLNSRKSPPTCTISLASANATDLCMNISSASYSLPATSVTSIIPFPSASTDFPISKPEATCLGLLRPSPGSPSQTRTRASSIQMPQERRKRSTARLSEPVELVKESDGGQNSTQPPRKRARLNKGSKSSGRVCWNAPELRFVALVQRSVACGVNTPRVACRSRSEQLISFEAQDRLLASRLRSRLLKQGVKRDDVVDLDDTTNLDVMDVDDEAKSLPLSSVNMDIDVEPPAKFTPSSPPRPKSPVSIRTVSPAELVAALIMRRGSVSARSVPSEWKRKPSPLAVCQPFTIIGYYPTEPHAGVIPRSHLPIPNLVIDGHSSLTDVLVIPLITGSRRLHMDGTHRRVNPIHDYVDHDYHNHMHRYFDAQALVSTTPQQCTIYT